MDDERRCIPGRCDTSAGVVAQPLRPLRDAALRNARVIASAQQSINVIEALTTDDHSGLDGHVCK